MTEKEFLKQMADVDELISGITETVAIVPDEANPANIASEWWTTQNAMTMSTTVLFFGVVVIIICAILMKKTQPSADEVLRVFGTVLIIVGALFLVVAGYTDQQMAPVMGLLGTLAGYLLGKAPTEKKNGSEKST